MKEDRETFHFPKDFQSRPEFRFLESEIGFQTACAAVMLIWRELAYLAEIQRLGFLRTDQATRIIEREFKKPDGTAFERDPIAVLVRATILLQCEDGYECRSFATHNRHLAADAINGSHKGAFFSSLKSKRATADREAREQANGFIRARFVRPNAEPMSDEEMRRTIMMVKLIDNIYGRPPRPPGEFTPGLINDAYLASGKHSQELINGVCYILATKWRRMDSGIPMRTEEALREFDHLVKQFGRIGIAQKKQREMRANEKREAGTVAIEAAA